MPNWVCESVDRTNILPKPPETGWWPLNALRDLQAICLCDGRAQMCNFGGATSAPRTGPLVRYTMYVACVRKIACQRTATGATNSGHSECSEAKPILISTTKPKISIYPCHQWNTLDSLQTQYFLLFNFYSRISSHAHTTVEIMCACCAAFETKILLQQSICYATNGMFTTHTYTHT